MIINQHTPEIIALRNGSGSATATFNKCRVYFSLYANSMFNLKAGMYATFSYRGGKLFMEVNNNPTGFKIAIERKDKPFLKIESKPLVTLLQRKICFTCPAKFYMMYAENNFKLIEIIIAKPSNKLGK